MTDKQLIEQYDKQLYEAVEMLRDAKLQIEHLHQKFQATGSGNATLSRINTLIDKVYESQFSRKDSNNKKTSFLSYLFGKNKSRK